MMRDDQRIGILAAWLVSCFSKSDHAPRDFFPPRLEDVPKPWKMPDEEIDAQLKSFFSEVRQAEASGTLAKVTPEEVKAAQGIV